MEHFIPGTQIRTTPRHVKNGYKERYDDRQKQTSPCAMQKHRTILVGLSSPPASGVGRDRDGQWNGTWIPMKAETRMRGRGNRR